MSSSAAVADHLPPNPSGNGEPQPVQPSLGRVRSPAPPSSPPLTDKDSQIIVVRNGNIGPDAHVDQDESEAETLVLSGTEKEDSARPKKVIKHERSDEEEGMRDIPSARSVVTVGSGKHAGARGSPAASGHSNGVREANVNGGDNMHSHGHRPAGRKGSSAFSSSDQDQSRQGPRGSNARHYSHSPPVGHDHRARSSSIADTRKRKLRDNHDSEPPRQRYKTEGLIKNSRHPPTSPLGAGVKLHKRSASTQSLVHSATGRRRREHTRQDKEWRSSDTEEEENSSPHPHSNIPPLTRPRRTAHRSMTSPVRAPPPMKRDAFGATRLLRACEKGDFDAVKAAYAHSPDELDAPDNAGVTPLQKASLNGHEDIVEFLIGKGCQTDVHDKLDCDTPLIDATQNGHVEVVKLLLWKARVDPMYENKHFKNALALLDPTADEADEIREELEKAMEERRKEGSDEDTDGRTPRSVEEVSGPTLLPNEYNTEVLRIKSEAGDKRAVDELLSFGILPNISCAVAAARGGHDEILSFLLASGLSADHRDPAKHNETPMLVAIKKGHVDVIKLLLAQDNFDPTRRNREGLTYFEFAEEQDAPNGEEIYALLKEKYDEKMKSKQSRRIRSPELQRSVQKSPRKRATEQESTRRTHEREARGRLSEKSSSKTAHSEAMSKPKKRLMSRRELNRQSRESTSPDASDEDDDDVRGPGRIVRRKTNHASKTIRSSPAPSSPEQEKSEPCSAPPKATEPEPEPEPTPPVKEETSEQVKEARRIEAERLAAEKARDEAEKERLAAVEKAERDHQERLDKLPRALKRACQHGKNRPLQFDLGNGEGGIGYNFLPVHVVKLSDLDPTCDASRRDELWMMSFQAVGILGLAELDCREFPLWEHISVTQNHLQAFLETYDISQLAEDPLFQRQGEKGYDPDKYAAETREAKAKFLRLDPLFWIRYDDFLKATQLPDYAHLEKLKIWTANARTHPRATTPPPTPRSWAEALFGVQPGPEWKSRSGSLGSSKSSVA